MVWPGIDRAINMALQLDFYPTRDELKAALRGKTARQAPPATVPSSNTPNTVPDLSDERIRAAVITLFESFVRSGGLKSELERFAPYRPHAGKALDYLIEKLDAVLLKEREAAAWALGRIRRVCPIRSPSSGS